jgi:hypothetical protein
VRTLQPILLSSIIFVGSAGLGYAEFFEGAIESQAYAPSQVNVKAKIFIKGHMVRSEIPMQVFNSTTTAYILTDMDRHQQTRIWPDKKLAVIEPWALKTMRGMKIPEFIKTGKRDMILGYPVEQFVIRAPDGQLMELWSTTELNLPPQVLPMYSGGLPQGEEWQEMEYFKRGYFSLRTVHKAANGAVKFQLEVKKVEKKALAPDLFTVPPDYQRTERGAISPVAPSMKER